MTDLVSLSQKLGQLAALALGIAGAAVADAAESAADPPLDDAGIRAAVAEAEPGEARSRIVLSWRQRQFAEAAAACATDSSPARCQAALVAWAEADRIRHALGRSPAGADTLACDTDQGLQACLAARFGPGILVDLPDSFAYMVHTTSPRVRVVTGGATTSGATLFRDAQLTSASLRAAVSGSEASRLGATRLNQTTGSSDQLFDRTIDGRHTWISPVHPGAVVVCDAEPRIVPLGPLVEVGVDGEGYHPERTAQHTTFTYSSPCEGYVIGRAVTTVQAGPYRPPASPSTTDNACHGPCALILTAPNGRQVVSVHAGEGAMGRSTALGDVNGDGVDDYAVWMADAAGFSQRLYLSSPTSWRPVAWLTGDT